MADVYANNVVFLCPMNAETLAARTIWDASPYHHQISLGGVGYGPNLGLSTAHVKYGNAACEFGGGANAWIVAQRHTVLDLASVDFTIEAWVYSTGAWRSTESTGLVCNMIQGSYTGYAFYINTAGRLSFNMGNSSSWAFHYSPTITVPVGQFAHVAVTLSGSTLRMFVDGVMSYEGAIVNNIVAASPSGSCMFALGNDPNNVNYRYLIGYMDDVRITNGVARYIANFTPPAAFEYTPLAIVADKINVDNYLSASPLPSPVFKYQIAQLGVNDMYYGGDGVIAGTIKNTPSSPVSRRVRLHESRTGVFVREGWSDSAGNYSFTNINRNLSYYVVGFDHTNEYQGVVADKLVPEAM